MVKVIVVYKQNDLNDLHGLNNTTNKLMQGSSWSYEAAGTSAFMLEW